MNKQRPDQSALPGLRAVQPLVKRWDDLLTRVEQAFVLHGAGNSVIREMLAIEQILDYVGKAGCTAARDASTYFKKTIAKYDYPRPAVAAGELETA